ncbi:outer membrane protein assembly factor BamB family protein [Tranquillimonas alkanivorans]|uniref:Outer membrane protein assembly factor BamB, contains PQQ-like beta-propeller repeat n=1 Tax=Tranquillimonas alkanivorans TaxID=441119 RepID=A0A1I5NT97_9RHOB|nr:PQQ-like beta-propeller repeat protein [Tranquillimonas alkanivorans]SFP24451.1 Outer membrane protein assembly factor BamB, contains PQQ-like beta-propeller repeat [Tranquillimonas alkanivorans]
MRKACIGGIAAITLLAACEKELILPGERLALRGDAATDTVEAGARSVPISLPAARANTQWTHKAGSPTHDTVHPAFSGAPQLLWSADVGQGEDRRHRITADPVVAGGRVFTVDSRARVSAHGLDGRPLWSVDLTPAGEDSDDASGAGLAVQGNTLYVSSAFGDLVALDTATGGERWRQALDASASGAPTVVGDLVYVAARDARGWAVETDTGRIRWTLPGTPRVAGIVGGASPAVTDRLAIFPFPSGELVATLRDGGTRVWQANVARDRLGKVYAQINDITGDPVISGGRVYAGNPAGRTVALDLASGELLWAAEDGAMSPVSVAGGAVFAVSDQAELVRLNAATGETVWRQPLPLYQPYRSLGRRDAVYAHYGPVLAGGRLWVASDDGMLRGFSPESGALVSSLELPGGATTNPVVAGGVMYLVTEDGQLLAFR